MARCFSRVGKSRFEEELSRQNKAKERERSVANDRGYSYVFTDQCTVVCLSVEDIAAVGGSSACTGTIRGRDTSCVAREKRENLGKLAPPCARLLRKPRSTLYSGNCNVILRMHVIPVVANVSLPLSKPYRGPTQTARAKVTSIRNEYRCIKLNYISG